MLACSNRQSKRCVGRGDPIDPCGFSLLGQIVSGTRASARRRMRWHCPASLLGWTSCSWWGERKALRAPVVSWEQEKHGKVLGTITDTRESERKAVEQRWPQVPHHVCQFPALRDASNAACEADKQGKTARRKPLQPKVRAVRTQSKKRLPMVSPDEATQLAVLDDDAAGVLTGLNTDGLQPCKDATVEASTMGEEIDASLAQLRTKGAREPAVCAQAGTPPDHRC